MPFDNDLDTAVTTPIPTQHDFLPAEQVAPLSQWIDSRLDDLETAFAEFTTQRSLLNSILRESR